MNNYLRLYRDDTLVREVMLGSAALELGSGPEADLHIPDSQVPARHLLVQQRGGSVWATSLSTPGRAPWVVPLGTPVQAGSRHTLVRVSLPQAATDDGSTLRLPRLKRGGRRWLLLYPRLGGDRGRTVVASRPILIGSASHCDVVLDDPAVSAEHCRLDPEGESITVRDLSSTNGTFLRGAEIRVARIERGAALRLGRTDLTIMLDDGSEAGPVAVSTKMRDLFARADRAASVDWPLLVLGPSGSGKEVLARRLHDAGPRRTAPFISENAGAIPRELVESHLFGHEKGAFTGAAAARRGLFEQAQGGTLFLDEIAELPLEQQAKLLRVLETWELRRLGAERMVKLDVRLVCATHRDLRKLCREGLFREDLYYRLARVVLEIPPLVQRGEDIAPLAEHFLARLGPDVGARALSREALSLLMTHDWPGNVRELRNVLEQAAFDCPGQQIELADVAHAIERVSGRKLRVVPPDQAAVLNALALCDGNLTRASRLLATPRTTLRDRMRRERG